MPTAELLTLITRRGISPAAVRAFRERRGATHEEMADVLGATPMEVAAWEAGTVRVPELQDARIRRLAAVDARAAAVAAAGLPACDWAAVHAPALHAELCLHPRAPLTGPLRRHVRACDACTRVRAFARTLPRLPFDPDAPAEAASAVFWRLIDPLPRHAQSAVMILGGTAAITGVALLAGPHLPDVEADPWFLLLVLLAARLFGEIVFETLERPLARALWRHPLVAELLRWTAGIGAGLAVCLSAVALPDTAGWAIPVGLALTFVLETLRRLGRRREKAAGASRIAAVAQDDEASRSTEADATPPAPVLLLADGDPLAAFDEARGHTRAEHSGAS